jgi:dTMP kinase
VVSRADCLYNRPVLPTKPLFIVLEGIDGAGTTTQTARVVAHLQRRGRAAAATREPSTGPVGRLLRELLLGGHRPASGAPLEGRTMALLFAADRVDHLQREIEPLLATGSDVVSDRYLLSSLAYQAEEADRTWVAALARGVRRPDVTLLLDLPVEVAAERRRRASRPVELYDDEALQRRIADNYRALARSQEDVVIVDARPEADEVTARLVEALEPLLARTESAR